MCAPDNASATCIVCSFTAALLLASLARWYLLLTMLYHLPFHYIVLLPCHAFVVAFAMTAVTSWQCLRG